MKHTKGPWRVDDLGPYIISGNTVDGTLQAVATYSEENTGLIDGDSEANAYILGAALDLFRACLKAHDDIGVYGGPLDTSMMLDKAIIKALKGISCDEKMETLDQIKWIEENLDHSERDKIIEYLKKDGDVL